MKKCLVLILLLAGFPAEGKAGLRVNFTNPVISGLSPGMVYSLKEQAGIPFTVRNTSEREHNIVVMIQEARGADIREGYENIPDIEWLSVFPGEFSLGPGEEMPCEIIIAIPEGEEFSDRNFTARVLATTRRDPDRPGMHFSLAYASIIRFSTGDTPEAMMAEHRQKIMDSLRITLEPFSVTLDGVEPGTTFLADGFDVSSPQLINRSRRDYELAFRSVESRRISRYGIGRGYEPAPDEQWLQIKNAKMTSGSMSIEHLQLELNIPDEEQYRGRNFAFVVLGRLTEYDVPVEVFSRVYVRTNE